MLIISTLICASCTRAPDKIANGYLFIEEHLTFKYLKSKGFVGAVNFNTKRICISLGPLCPKTRDTQEIIANISLLQKKVGNPPVRVKIYKKGFFRRISNEYSFRFTGLVKVLDLKPDVTMSPVREQRAPVNNK